MASPASATTGSVVVVWHARRRAAAFLATVGLGIGVVTLAACFDRATAPPPALAPAPRHDFAGDPDWGANNSASGGNYDGIVDQVYGGAPMGTVLGPFVYPTFVTMNVSGQVRQVPGALQGSNIVREAWSTNDPAYWGSMGFLNTSTGDRWYPVGPTAVLRIVAPIRGFRNDAGGQPTGDWSHCGWAGYALCWTWSGSAHLDFTSIHVGLTLTQSPDTTVWQGTSATFTAGRTQTYFPPNPYPVDLSALQWRWIPDSATADTVACHSFLGETCTRVFTTSGTMYTAAYVNGEAQQKSVHVSVRIPELSVSAPGSVLVPGDSVTATATGNGPLVVQGWSFTPGPAGGTPPAVGAGSSWGSCTQGKTTCRNFVATAGTISVIGTVNGVQLTAHTHVDMVPPKITLIAVPTTIVAGDTSTFTATANGTPMVVQGWAFQADGGTGPGATMGSSWGTCVPYNPECTMVVPTSGMVFVTGTVAGYASSDSEHVTVTFPPGCGPALARSSTDTARLAPATTRSTAQLSVPSRAAMDCIPDSDPSGPDSLLVNCHATGSTDPVTTRGESVTCNARLRSRKAFTINATGSGIGTVEGVGSWPISFASADPTFYATTGTAAVTTTITATATRSEDGASLPSLTTFVVRPRQVNPIMLESAVSQDATELELSTSASPGGYLTFGKYIYDLYDNTVAAPPTKAVAAGPNAGLAFLLTWPETAPGGVARINKALRGVGAWAADQADIVGHTDTAPAPYYSTRWCRPSDFSHLVDITEIHEGTRQTGLPPLTGHPERPGTSHHDINKGVVAEHLAGRLEGLVFAEAAGTDRTQIWGYVNTAFSHVQWDISHPLDMQFDSLEDAMPVLYSSARFGCQDYLPWKGGNP